MLWAIRHIVFFGLCFGWMLQAGSTFAQHPEADGRVVGGVPDDPATHSDIEFIPNRGQIADQSGKPMPQVLYTMASVGVRINFTNRGMQFIFSRVLHDSSGSQSQNFFSSLPERFSELHKNDSVKFFRLDLAFDGANLNPRVEAFELANDYTNYYLPWCPNGIVRVPAYHKIIYHDLYPHIDLVLYSSPQSTWKEASDPGPHYPFEYDFIIHPGGNPSQIRMHYLNPDSVNVDENGNAFVSTMLGFLRDHAPYSYMAGTGKPVASSFRRNGATFHFVTVPYDSTRTLIIDPPRLWGTYYGGPTWDQIGDVTTDKDDNIIAVGISQSASGISSPGAFQTTLSGTEDAMIVKLSPSGSRLWATYYGSSDGFAVITDQSGNIYAGGQANSAGLATPGAFQTTPSGGFLVKFDPTGARLWGTYFNAYIYALAVDSNSNVFMTGFTSYTTGVGTAGTYLPTNPTSADVGFLATFTPSGVRRWGTYFYGTNLEKTHPFRVTVALNGDIAIGGETNDTIGIATTRTFDTVYGGNIPGDFGGFVAEFDTSGQRKWATYVASPSHGIQNSGVSGLSYDHSSGILVGGSGAANVATPGAYQTTGPGFLLRLDTLGQRVWGTYLGNTVPSGVAVDKSYDVVIGGYTWNTSGVASTGEYQTTYGGGVTDAFIAKFTTSGTFHWGTYYGGTGEDVARGFVLDREGHPIIAGWTTSTNAIASAGSFEPTYPAGSSQSGFIAKFCDTVHAPLFFSSRSNTICYGDRDTLTAGVGFLNYQWKQNGTLLSTTGNQYVLPTLSPGNYSYTVSVVDPDACASNVDTLPIFVLAPPVDTFIHNVSICHGSSIRIGDTATGAGPPFIYAWTPATGLDHPDSAEPIATPLTTTTYYLFVTDTNGCQTEDSVTVQVNPLPRVNAGGNKTICYGDSTSIGGTATLGTPPFVYHWSPANGLSNITQPVVTAFPPDSTKYFLQVTDINGCEATDSVIVAVNPLPHPPVLVNEHVCLGFGVQIGGLATFGKVPYQYSWSPATGLSSPNIAEPMASPTSTTSYTLTITDADGCDTTASQIVTVFVPPFPIITADSTVAYCATDSALLDAGPGYVSYLWSNGRSGQAIHAGAGTYTVTVTDSNGCSGTSAPLTITPVAPPPALISGPTSECPNSVTGYHSEDQGIASYTWSLLSGGTIQSGQGTDSLTVDWTTPGTWQLALIEKMDAGGCERDTTLSVAITDSLQPAISITGPGTICTGDTVILAAPSGYNSYRWADGETTSSIIATQTGDYFVHVTNASGCSGTSSPAHITVLADSVPRPVLIASSNVICEGDSVQVGLEAPTYASYLWSTSATTPAIFVSKAGAYSVTVSNADGCTGTSAPMTFSVQPLPRVQLAASGPTTFCAGDSVTLEVTPGFRYTWWKNGTTLPETTADLLVSASGSYAVTATDAAGCDTTPPPIAVTVEALPAVAITGPASICIGGRSGYRIQPLAGSSIAWQINPAGLGSITSGQGTDTITVQWGSQASGTLEVAVTNAVGCTGMAALPIAIDSHLTPLVTPPGPLAFCPGDSMTLDAGAGYASYQWSLDGNAISGASKELFTASQSGNYTVFVTNAGGCSGSSQEMAVTIYPPPVKPVITRGGSQLTSSGAAAYQWSFMGTPQSGDTMQTVSPAQDGSYFVTITDANGCTATSDPVNFTNAGSVTVMLPPATGANPGDRVSIPIVLINPTNVIESGATTYAGTVSFNATMLAPQGTLGIVTGVNRTIAISGTLPAILTSGMTLQSLDFTATLGTDTCTPLTIDTFYFPNANIAVTREDGDFCLSGVCMDGGRARLIDPNALVSLSEVRPNPASSSVEIDYHLGEEGPTKLYLQDMLGRTALVIRDGWMKPGSYSDQVNIGELPSGAYRLVLRTPSDLLTKRMEVAK